MVEGRYPPRDRIWLGANSVQLVTPNASVDLEQLRKRIDELSQKEPLLRWFRTPGRVPDRYRQAGDAAAASALAERLVQAWPSSDGPGTTLESATAAVLNADDGTPAPAIFAGHGSVGQLFPHVLGDGISALSHLRRLGVGFESPSPAPFPLSGQDRPLAAALRRRYLSHGWASALKQLRADLSVPRPAPPGAPEGAASAPGAKPAIKPSIQIVIRSMDADRVQALKQWRRTHTGAGLPAIQIAGIRRGLADAGLLTPQTGMFVVFDLRPFLKSNHSHGNFISVPYLVPDNPTDPVSVAASLSSTMDSGLPLIVLARGAARATLRRSSGPSPVRPSSQRTVSFSHMVVGRLLDPPLFTPADGPMLMVSATRPVDEGNLSFMICEHGRTATVTAVFCSPFTAREPVEQILDHWVTDPLALLPA